MLRENLVERCGVCRGYGKPDTFPRCQICFVVCCFNRVTPCFSCGEHICMGCMADQAQCWICQYRNRQVFNPKYCTHLSNEVQSQIFTMMLIFNRCRDKYWSVPKCLKLHIISFVININTDIPLYLDKRVLGWCGTEDDSYDQYDFLPRCVTNSLGFILYCRDDSSCIVIGKDPHLTGKIQTLSKHEINFVESMSFEYEFMGILLDTD